MIDLGIFGICYMHNMLEIIIFPANATDAYDYDPAAPFDSWVGLGNQDDTTVDYNDDGDSMSPAER